MGLYHRFQVDPPAHTLHGSMTSDHIHDQLGTQVLLVASAKQRLPLPHQHESLSMSGAKYCAAKRSCQALMSAQVSSVTSNCAWLCCMCMYSHTKEFLTLDKLHMCRWFGFCTASLMLCKHMPAYAAGKTPWYAPRRTRPYCTRSCCVSLDIACARALTCMVVPATKVLHSGLDGARKTIEF